MSEKNILRQVSAANSYCQSNTELMWCNCVYYSEEKPQNMSVIQQKVIYAI